MARGMDRMGLMSHTYTDVTRWGEIRASKGRGVCVSIKKNKKRLSGSIVSNPSILA